MTDATHVSDSDSPAVGTLGAGERVTTGAGRPLEEKN